MRAWILPALLAFILPSLTGCGDSGRRPVQNIEVKEADPINEAKALLTNYVNGQPVTSEAESFPDLIKRVKEKDPAKGAILEKGLADIMKVKAAPAGKAKELLKKL